MAQPPERPAKQGAVLPDAAEPLVLIGPPRGVRGEFRVQNPTERKIIVRQPLLRRAAAAARGKGAAAKAAAAAMAIPEEALALRRIVVRPDNRVQCRSR